MVFENRAAWQRDGFPNLRGRVAGSGRVKADVEADARAGLGKVRRLWSHPCARKGARDGYGVFCCSLAALACARMGRRRKVNPVPAPAHASIRFEGLPVLVSPLKALVPSG